MARATSSSTWRVTSGRVTTEMPTLDRSPEMSVTDATVSMLSTSSQFGFTGVTSFSMSRYFFSTW